jgi:hypothetical protein
VHPKKEGDREVLRYYEEEEYVDRIKGYRGSFLYKRALRKRRVWGSSPCSAEPDLHGLRRFRLRR